jgi:hypothetical protein
VFLILHARSGTTAGLVAAPQQAARLIYKLIATCNNCDHSDDGRDQRELDDECAALLRIAEIPTCSAKASANGSRDECDVGPLPAELQGYVDFAVGVLAV